MKIQISEIKVHDRTRLEKGDIKDLARSFLNVGQLNDIIIDDDNVLVAGERRILAAKSLGWLEIGAKRKNDLTEEDKLLIEYEENAGRKDLTWDEKLKSAVALHKMKVAIHGKAKQHIGGGWSIKKTAEMLGQAEGKMVQDLQLSEAIKTDKELLNKPTKTSALAEMKKKNDLHERKLMALLSLKEPEVSSDKIEKQDQEAAKTVFKLGNIFAFHHPCLDVLKDLNSDSVDCIFTDPPYAIDYDKSTNDTRRNKWKHLTFDDSEDVMEDIVKPAMAECYRLLRPGYHGYMFCSGDMFDVVKKMLLDCKFQVCSSPLIWYKPHVFFAHNPYHTYKYDYEMCVLFSKGKRKELIQPAWAVWNGRLGPGERGLHPNRKPVELAKAWISNSTIENELVIDPFGGSGFTSEACYELGRRCIIMEKDVKWWSVIVSRLRELEGKY
uniref:Putative methyltransferase n=1 Tax=viral metagenome TaxID=1070528 RepID=A0A6M3KEM0_9ZZZZ